MQLRSHRRRHEQRRRSKCRSWHSKRKPRARALVTETISQVSRKLFSLRESRRGGDELRTHVYPSNLAPIAAKLRENAFQTICNFRFFDAGKKKRFFFSDFFSVFHDFRQILEELGIFGRQNQIPRGILLQMVKFSGV